MWCIIRIDVRSKALMRKHHSRWQTILLRTYYKNTLINLWGFTFQNHIMIIRDIIVSALEISTTWCLTCTDITHYMSLNILPPSKCSRRSQNLILRPLEQRPTATATRPPWRGTNDLPYHNVYHNDLPTVKSAQHLLLFLCSPGHSGRTVHHNMLQCFGLKNQLYTSSAPSPHN